MKLKSILPTMLAGVIAVAAVAAGGVATAPVANAAPGCQSFGITWTGTQTGAVKLQCESVQAKREYRTAAGSPGSVTSPWSPNNVETIWT